MASIPEQARPPEDAVDTQFEIAVLGRTLEHLGVQLYRQRPAAISELVSNSWDADATEVRITVPIGDYDPSAAAILVADNGHGMSEGAVRSSYLVVGRNRRASGDRTDDGRAVIGSKGIGKLAGFGIAKRMTVLTWDGVQQTCVDMALGQLRAEDGTSETKPLAGYTSVSRPALLPDTYRTGTVLLLTDLKTKTPFDPDGISEALTRRFSRTVRGRMTILVNGTPLGEPEIEWEYRFPGGDDFEEVGLGNGTTISYFIGFSLKPLPRKELTGFTVMVRGKTAQAPPFFFDVESKTWSQGGLRYLTGEVHADFVDPEGGAEDDPGADWISTDRQQLDWEQPELQPLLQWGADQVNTEVRKWGVRRSEQTEQWVDKDTELHTRLTGLGKHAEKAARALIRRLGQAARDQAETLPLVDYLLRAYEYQHFVDLVGELEAADSPDKLVALLDRLHEWQILESRAILEVVKGRLHIVDVFREMVVDRDPEDAKRAGANNLHDLIGMNPWLLNPEWQVLAEEKTITAYLQAQYVEDVPDDPDRRRFDFLCLTGSGRHIVVDIKRPGHAVTYEELIRLEGYGNKLEEAHEGIYLLMVASSVALAETTSYRQGWVTRPNGDIVTWSELCERASRYYTHYRGVLEGDVSDPSFQKHANALHMTRRMDEEGTTYRSKKRRREEGLGPQFLDMDEPDADA